MAEQDIPKDIQEILSQTDDRTFGPDDWNVVILECRSLTSKWELLSGYLGLSFTVIDTIKAVNHRNIINCWNEALKEWIKQNFKVEKFGKPSWRSLLGKVWREDKLIFQLLAANHRVDEEFSDTLVSRKEEPEETLTEGVCRVLKLSHDGKEMTNDKDTVNSKDDNTDREEEGVFRVLKLSHDGKEMTNDKDTGNSKDDNTDREEDISIADGNFAVDIINNKFLNLVRHTEKSLKDRNLSVNELLHHLLGMKQVRFSVADMDHVLIEERIPGLTKPTTIEDVMKIVSISSSYFNFQMIELIINELGTIEDKKVLFKYMADFTTYAENIICDCPITVGLINDGAYFIFSIVLHESYYCCTLHHLHLFVNGLRKIVAMSSASDTIKEYEIQLYEVKPLRGGLQLTLKTTSRAKTVLLSLQPEQRTALAEVDVTQLYYEDKEIFNVFSEDKCSSTRTSGSEIPEEQSLLMVVEDIEEPGLSELRNQPSKQGQEKFKQNQSEITKQECLQVVMKDTKEPDVPEDITHTANKEEQAKKRKNLKQKVTKAVKSALSRGNDSQKPFQRTSTGVSQPKKDSESSAVSGEERTVVLRGFDTAHYTKDSPKLFKGRHHKYTYSEFKVRHLNPKMGKDSIQLAYFDTKSISFNLNSDALDLLKSLSKPVAVLSICGPARTGKSYYLSRMLKIDDAFKTNFTMNPCTSGIWMATSILECKDFAVVLLDTEGTDAAKADEDSTVMKYLCFVTLLSSYLVYNSSGSMHNSDLDRMSHFAKLSESVMIRKDGALDDLHEENLKSHFPHFMWLVRDCELECTLDSGEELSATKYFTDQLLSHCEKGGQTTSQSVRRALVTLFPSLECRVVPHPYGKPGKQAVESLNPSFNKALDESFEFLCSNIQTKCAFDKRVQLDGPLLVRIAEQYAHMLNQPDAIPILEISWQNAIKQQLLQLSVTLVQQYQKEMEETFKGEPNPLEEGSIDAYKSSDGVMTAPTVMSIHCSIYEPKLKKLRDRANYLMPSVACEDPVYKTVEEEKKVLMDEFKKQIVKWDDNDKPQEGSLKTFVDRNFSRSSNYCTELFHSIYKDNLPDVNLKRLESEYYKKCKGPAKDKIFQQQSKRIPGQPEDLKAETIKHDAISITWNAPKANPHAVKFYQVIFFSSEDSDKKRKNYVVEQKMMYDHLLPNSQYHFQICACNENIFGEYSDVLPVWTQAGVPSKPPTPFQIQPISPTEAKFSMLGLPEEQQNGSVVNELRIEMKTDCASSEWNTTKIFPIDGTAEYIEEMISLPEIIKPEEKTLYFRVRMGNEAGLSDYSETISVFTSELFPGTVEDLKTTSIEPNKIVLRWNLPKSNPFAVRCINIKFNNKGKETIVSKWERNDMNGHEFTGLQPATSYIFEFTCSNMRNQSEVKSIQVSTKSNIPNRPSIPLYGNVDVDGKKQVVLIVNRLKAEEANGSEVNKLIIETANDKEITKWTRAEISGLVRHDNEPIQVFIDPRTSSESSVFYYRIRFENDIGESEPSEPVTIPVARLYPLQPINLRVPKESITSRSAVVRWNPPNINSRSVSFYLLQHKRDDFNESWSSPPTQVLNECYEFNQQLRPGSAYIFRVASCNETFTGEWSKPCKFTTEADKPSRPKKPHIYIEPKENTEQSSYILCVRTPIEEDQNGSPITYIAVDSRSSHSPSWDTQTYEYDASLLEKRIPIQPHNAISHSVKMEYRIRLKNSVGFSESSPSCEISASQMIPGPPQNLRSQETYNTITLQWNEPELNPKSVEYYSIERNNANPEECKDWLQVKLSERSHQQMSVTISDNLGRGRDYFFRASSFNKDGKMCGIHSSIIKVKIEPCKPSTPDHKQILLKVTNPDKADITVPIQSAEDTGSEIFKLIVHERNEHGGMISVKEFDIAADGLCGSVTRSIDIGNETHYVTVALQNRKGVSDISELVGVAPNDLIPGPPRSVKVKDLSARNTVVQWSAPLQHPRAAKEYETQVKVIQGRDSQWNPIAYHEHEVDHLRHTAVLTDLKPGVKYELRIQAQNGTIKGEWSDKVTFKIDAMKPKQPPTPSVKQNPDNYEEVKLSIPHDKEGDNGAPISQIICEWSELREHWHQMEEYEVPDTDTEKFDIRFPLKSVEKPTTSDVYYYVVKLKNEVGESSACTNPAKLNLSSLLPGEVQDLQSSIKEKTTQSITLTWKPPKVHPGIVKKYKVAYKHVDNDRWEQENEILSTEAMEFEHKFDGLSINKTYKFRVTPMNSRNCDGIECCIEDMPEEVYPGAPNKLIVRAWQNDKLKICWEEPMERKEALHSYRIEIEGGEFKKSLPHDDLQNLCKVIKDLKAFTKYAIKVTALNEKGNYTEKGIAIINARTCLTDGQRRALKWGVGVPTLGIGYAIVHYLTKPSDDSEMKE